MNGNSLIKKEMGFYDRAIALMAGQLNVKDAQIQALTERNEFLEDLIAELAIQVYTTPPSA